MTDRSKYSNVSLSNKTYVALKKLSKELLEFGYNLKNDQGKWEIYKNE